MSKSTPFDSFLSKGPHGLAIPTKEGCGGSDRLGRVPGGGLVLFDPDSAQCMKGGSLHGADRIDDFPAPKAVRFLRRQETPQEGACTGENGSGVPGPGAGEGLVLGEKRGDQSPGIVLWLQEKGVVEV